MTEIIRQYMWRNYCQPATQPRQQNNRSQQQLLHELLEMEKMTRNVNEWPRMKKNPSGLNCVLQLLTQVQEFSEILLTTARNGWQQNLKQTVGRMLFSKYALQEASELSEHFSKEGNTVIWSIFDGLTKAVPQPFFGQMTSYVDDMEIIKKNESAFNRIQLDCRHKSLKTAFQAYKMKKNAETTTTIEINQPPKILTFSLLRQAQDFIFPFSLNLSDNSPVDKEQLKNLQLKIQRLEKLIEKKQHVEDLQSLKVTLNFLSKQDFQDIEQAKVQEVTSVPIKDDELNDILKQSLNWYCDKLQKQDENINKSLQQAKQQRKSILIKSNTYNLFAILMKQNEQHWLALLKDRKWKKISDKQIVDIEENELKKKAYEYAIGLFYRVGGTVPLSAHATEEARKLAILHDYNLGRKIDEMRVERLLRTYSDLATEQVSYYSEQFKKSELAFIEYFASPLYHFLNDGRLKQAELVTFHKYLQEHNFLEEARRLLDGQEVAIPAATLSPSKQYVQHVNVLKSCVLFETEGKILNSIGLLAQMCSIPNKNGFVTDCLEKMLVLFMLKGCFYVDLQIQLAKNTDVLLNFLTYVMNLMPKSIHKQQILQNLKNSYGILGLRMPEKPARSFESQQLHEKSADVDLSRLIPKRLKLWLEFYTQILRKKKTIPQEERQSREIPHFFQHNI